MRLEVTLAVVFLSLTVSAQMDYGFGDTDPKVKRWNRLWNSTSHILIS